MRIWGLIPSSASKFCRRCRQRCRTRRKSRQRKSARCERCARSSKRSARQMQQPRRLTPRLLFNRRVAQTRSRSNPSCWKSFRKKPATRKRCLNSIWDLMLISGLTRSSASKFFPRSKASFPARRKLDQTRLVGCTACARLSRRSERAADLSLPVRNRRTATALTEKHLPSQRRTT